MKSWQIVKLLNHVITYEFSPVAFEKWLLFITPRASPTTLNTGKKQHIHSLGSKICKHRQQETDSDYPERE
jgi:hypothetical protein